MKRTMSAQEVAEEAKKMAEAQANDINAFQTMGVEAAEEAGKKAGEESGKEAGAVAGEKVALESVMKEAMEAAEKAGAAIFGEEGAKGWVTHISRVCSIGFHISDIKDRFSG